MGDRIPIDTSPRVQWETETIAARIAVSGGGGGGREEIGAAAVGFMVMVMMWGFVSPPLCNTI
jgi:hypothetical protein